MWTKVPSALDHVSSFKVYKVLRPGKLKFSINITVTLCC
jgi:hypothetical protein